MVRASVKSDSGFISPACNSNHAASEGQRSAASSVEPRGAGTDSENAKEDDNENDSEDDSDDDVRAAVATTDDDDEVSSFLSKGSDRGALDQIDELMRKATPTPPIDETGELP